MIPRFLEDYPMAWNTLKHTKSKVDRAGGTLKSGNEHGTFNTEALDVINNFRSSHGYPLHVITMRLRQNAPKIDDQAIVAQRLKRLVSIDAKLRRFSWLKLSRMQDIGGCRAVLRSVTKVERLHEWYSTRQCSSKLRRVDNYIKNPKSDGYRGIHYVYEYRSTTEQYEVYNGFQVEVQLRSALQHAWATATETVSTFTGQRLKGGVGEVQWFRFFTLMANALAMREKRALVPDAPDDEGELVAELTDLAGELNVEVVLRGWQTAMEILGDAPKDARVFLLVLNPTERTLEAIPFSAEHAALASNRYLEVEKEIAKKPNIEAVLVKTDSVAALRKAYPNYYVDMNSFLNAMDLALHPPVLAG